LISTRDLEWAAGFIDGEGCFYVCKRTGVMRVTVAQNDRWPLDKLTTLFGGAITPAKTPKGKPSWQWHLVGSRGAGLIMTLYPLMSPRRQEKIKDCIRTWKSFPAKPHKNLFENPLHASGRKAA
jgi:hypothetical protein